MFRTLLAPCSNSSTLTTEQINKDCILSRWWKWMCNFVSMRSNDPSAKNKLADVSITKRVPLSDGFGYHLYESMNNVPEDWDRLIGHKNLFLSRTYLQLLEDFPPNGMRFRYLLFYKNEKPVGLAMCQIQYFKADESIKKEEPNGFWSNIAQNVKEKVASQFEFVTLVNGNLLLTGKHGYYFNENAFENGAEIKLLEAGLNSVLQTLKDNGIKINATLIKDIPEEINAVHQPLINSAYQEFTIQPSMILDVCWDTFETYTNALSSKYRVRMKRAFKKADGIERQVMTLENINTYLPRIYELYRVVVSNSGFNSAHLNKAYLYGLKERLGDQFEMIGYFYDDQLIAYHTTILNGNELEAHFLGYDENYNRNKQVYHNILFDILKKGIEKGVHRIVYARTALEIKSSIGAKPHEMYCYFRHRSVISNKLAGSILDYLKPNDQWIERHPFK